MQPSNYTNTNKFWLTNLSPRDQELLSLAKKSELICIVLDKNLISKEKIDDLTLLREINKIKLAQKEIIKILTKKNKTYGKNNK